MGISIDGICIKYDNFINLLPEGTDLDKVRKIFEKFGIFEGNNYYTINDEYHEEENPWYGLSNVLNSFFGEEVDYLWKCDYINFPPYNDVYEVCDELGIKMLEYE